MGCFRDSCSAFAAASARSRCWAARARMSSSFFSFFFMGSGTITSFLMTVGGGVGSPLSRRCRLKDAVVGAKLSI